MPDSSAVSSVSPVPAGWSAGPLRNSAVRELDGPSGRCRLTLVWPDGPAPASGWPLLVMAEDAHLDMARALAWHHAGAPKARLAEPGVILALGYVGPSRREHDFTPPGRPGAGGAPAFLAWITDTVLALAHAALPLDAARRTLAGHSLGGLLTLQACLTRPGHFSTYLVSSPSVWWGDGFAAQLASTSAAAPPALDARLCLSVGEYEQALSPDELTWPDRDVIAAQRQGRAMVDRMTELDAILREIPGLRLDYTVIPAETHRSVIPRALDVGVRVAFAFPAGGAGSA